MSESETWDLEADVVVLGSGGAAIYVSRFKSLLCTVGSGVLGGTISSTSLGILLVPLFFVVVVRLFTRKRKA